MTNQLPATSIQQLCSSFSYLLPDEPELLDDPELLLLLPDELPEDAGEELRLGDDDLATEGPAELRPGEEDLAAEEPTWLLPGDDDLAAGDEDPDEYVEPDLL